MTVTSFMIYQARHCRPIAAPIPTLIVAVIAIIIHLSDISMGMPDVHSTISAGVNAMLLTEHERVEVMQGK